MKDILDYISLQGIQYIDIRLHNQNSMWCSYTIVAHDFSAKIVANVLNLSVDQLRFDLDNRSFIDPFVSHKTLVLMLNIYEYNEDLLTQYNNQEVYKYNFKFSSQEIIPEQFTNTYNYYQTDMMKNIRGEIVLSLIDMKVPVVAHYYEKNDYLVVHDENDVVRNIDNLQKIYYAIHMICNIYKIKYQSNFGIFTIQDKFIKPVE